VVLDWNKPALGFYERFGAQRLAEWITMRLTQADFRRLLTE
jgi:hypothetical protein